MTYAPSHERRHEDENIREIHACIEEGDVRIHARIDALSRDMHTKMDTSLAAMRQQTVTLLGVFGGVFALMQSLILGAVWYLVVGLNQEKLELLAAIKDNQAAIKIIARDMEELVDGID